MKSKQFNCEVVKISEPSDKKKVFKFVASTPQPDRSDDIIEVAGWDTKNWEKNPVILWGHKHHELPIGRGVKVHKNLEKQALEVDVEFASEEYPFAATVEKLTEKGYIKAVSVGFKAIKSEPREDVEGAEDMWFPPLRFMEQELLELSMVSVPANPSALLVTNSVDRDLMFQKGLALGAIRQVEFGEALPPWTPEQIESWMKEHDFNDFVPVPNSPNVFRQKEFDPATADTLRWLNAAPGIRVLVAKHNMPPAASNFFNEASCSTAWGTSTASMPITWSNMPDTGVVKELSTLKETLASLLQTQHTEQLKVIQELRDVTKAIASLYELGSEDIVESPVTPAVDSADKVSEQWMNDVKEALVAAKTILSENKE